MTISKQFNKYKTHLLVLLIALIVGGVTSSHLGQDVNWDLLNYHYYSGYALIHNRINLDVAPGQFETYVNPIINLPGYLLIDHFSPKTAGVVLGAIQGVNIWIVFELALLLTKRIKIKHNMRLGMSLFIAVLSFFGAASISEVGNTMGDNLVSIPILLSLLLLLYSVQEKNPRYNPKTIRLLAYFLVGFAVGLKLTAVVYAIPIFLAGFIIEDEWVKRLRQSGLHFLSIVVGVLVSSGFWFVILWDKFKNPVFPYYNAIFKSPYYPQVNFTDKRWFHAGIGHVLFYPFYFVKLQTLSSEEPFRDPRIAVVYSLLFILLVVAIATKLIRKRDIFKNIPKEYVIFWIFFILSYIIWEKQFSYYRYLLPTELLSLIAISIIIYKLVENVLVASSLVVICIVLITIFTVPINWGRMPWQSTYFGVSKSEFKNLDNSTVLVAGYDPFSFLIPYFPASSSTIRIESDLSSPMMGTYAEQKAIRTIVLQKEKQGKPFYALVSDEEYGTEEQAFNVYGFKTLSCQEIFLYVRQTSQAKVRLCTLQQVHKLSL